MALGLWFESVRVMFLFFAGVVGSGRWEFSRFHLARALLLNASRSTAKTGFFEVIDMGSEEITTPFSIAVPPLRGASFDLACHLSIWSMHLIPIKAQERTHVEVLKKGYPKRDFVPLLWWYGCTVSHAHESNDAFQNHFHWLRFEKWKNKTRIYRKAVGKITIRNICRCPDFSCAFQKMVPFDCVLVRYSAASQHDVELQQASAADTDLEAERRSVQVSALPARLEDRMRTWLVAGFLLMT